jgi:hypothetical protein
MKDKEVYKNLKELFGTLKTPKKKELTPTQQAGLAFIELSKKFKKQ